MATRFQRTEHVNLSLTFGQPASELVSFRYDCVSGLGIRRGFAQYRRCRSTTGDSKMPANDYTEVICLQTRQNFLLQEFCLFNLAIRNP